ncbi:MAG: hypothetical protein ACHQF4_11340, partial [Sphingobacteriales bacterium]
MISTKEKKTEEYWRNLANEYEEQEEYTTQRIFIGGFEIVGLSFDTWLRSANKWVMYNNIIFRFTHKENALILFKDTFGIRQTQSFTMEERLRYYFLFLNA